ncbi:EexN family lipoprotein [Acidisoma sp. C75]
MRNLLRIIIAGCLLSLAACSDGNAAHYRADHKAFLRELIHCENNYATERDTPACRAAFRVNAELFPG